MRVQNSAIVGNPVAVRTGTTLAALGVLSFSFSLPATAWALDGFGPWTVTAVRCALAGLLAAVALRVARVPLPDRRQIAPILVVALGCVVLFPLLSTLALQTTSTGNAAVVVGAMPIATAAYAAVRTGVRHSPVFWAAAVTGTAVVVAFTFLRSGGVPSTGDLYMIGAVVGGAAGYAEGGRLAARTPGWRVIAWALVFSLPVFVPASALALALEPAHPTPTAVTGLAYLVLVSQFAGFVAWYGGMAIIGVARGSQLQLAQPVLTLSWAVLLLGEPLTPSAPIAAVAVLACIIVTQRVR
ncbi:DMT family transporter [Nocardiopsis sp. NPDC050513]|uniref:DMT family transporter n=1 Tax=Nocardiopsis sp. NPDC050513 TaxID=3364338 RepID=UPI0037AB1AB2